MKKTSKIFALSLLAGLSLSIAASNVSENQQPLITAAERQAIQDQMAELQKQFSWTQEDLERLCKNPEIHNFVIQVQNAETMEEKMAYIDAFKDSDTCENMPEEDKKLLAIIMANILGEKAIELMVAQQRAEAGLPALD